MAALEHIIPQGRVLMMGNDACSYGALAARCNFFGGYPITPSSEIPRLMSELLPKVGGVFIQMEDELSSIASCIGASWAGRKPMTATSGPGMSLMAENIGYAFMTETPVVIIDTQRAGPSTGQAAKGGQGDVMQARFGTHGDYEAIALSPNGVLECFTLTVKAFNLAERYRTPVTLLSDAVVAHLREAVDIPALDEIEVVERKRPRNREEGLRPFGTEDMDKVPPMPRFGEGYDLLITGSTHTPTGVRNTVDRHVHEELVGRLNQKITDNRGEIEDWEERYTRDCDLLAISHGVEARPTLGAVEKLRDEGHNIGFFRPVVLWPSPERRLKALAKGVKRVYLPEMSLRGYRMEVERIFGDKRVLHIPKLSEVHTSEEIYQVIKRDLEGAK